MHLTPTQEVGLSVEKSRRYLGLGITQNWEFESDLTVTTCVALGM